MRILNIRFRNLNSLVGDWSIDLCAPEYEANGIFAITGPTGAGKSTILDAVCLALYGSTPRLGKISKSTNEIMSRGTGDCNAEVTFLTTHGKYRCRWSQRRARGKAGGELQQPRHELFDAAGTPLADKINDVAAKIEELTGMDFARFTQSTLLAQGRFASFLLAEGRDRAPLLEQMTGTAIYSDISSHIFRRHKSELEKLAALDAELEHCRALSEDEEKALRENCQALARSIAEATEKEKALEAELQLLRLAASLEQEHEALLADQTKLEGQLKDFAADQAKLHTAQRALLFASDCTALLTRQQEQDKDSAEARTLGEALAPLSDAVSEQEHHHASCEQALARERQSHADLLDTLKSVRALDVQRAARQQELQAREEAEKAALAKQAQAAEKLAGQTEQLQQNRASLSDIAAWLEARAEDEALPQTLAALRISADQLDQQAKRIRSRQTLLAEKRLELERRTRDCEALALRHKASAGECARLESDIAALEQQKLQCLDGRNAVEWRREQESLSDLVARLDGMLEAVRRCKVLKEEEAALNAQVMRLDHDIEQGRAGIEAEKIRLDTLEELRRELNDSLSLIEQIRSYEEARLHLRDGEACPLCGSLHHPFSSGAIPQPNEKRERLLECERNIRSLNLELNQHGSALAAQERDREHSLAKLREKAEEAERLNALLAREAESLPPDAEAGLTLEALEQLRSEARKRQSVVSGVLLQVEALQERLEKLRREQELARKQANLAMQEFSEIERRKTALFSEAQALASELDTEELRHEADFEALRLRLLPLGHVMQTLAELPAIFDNIEARISAFLKKKNEADALGNACQHLEKLCLVSEQELSDIEHQLHSIGTEREQISAALALLKKERLELFGENDADTAEAEATSLLRQAEARHKDSLARLEALRKKKGDVEVRLAVLTRRLDERAGLLAADEAKLLGLLAEAGFRDLRHCLESCLSESERTALELRERTLHDSEASLQARLLDNERRRKDLKTLPALSEEELQASLEAVSAQRSALQEELGATREKIETNEARKKTAADIQDVRALQEKTCRRWADLNKLIGSSDGQRFRNYAQELTFRILIQHANRQLSSMTDRYILVQDPKEALALSVIDRYQADTVRTSRNLSGGESFLVSLSLALGLARMASQSVRVDSVFLDEGFGTLDEDSLSMALDMLSNLRAQGKTIGVISHVQTIQERIGMRILVEPEGNGRSRLQGPGVERKQA